jgi:hypothetical protein
MKLLRSLGKVLGAGVFVALPVYALASLASAPSVRDATQLAAEDDPVATSFMILDRSRDNSARKPAPPPAEDADSSVQVLDNWTFTFGSGISIFR